MVDPTVRGKMAALQAEVMVILGLPVLAALMAGAVWQLWLSATELGFGPGTGVGMTICFVLPGVGVAVSIRAWRRSGREGRKRGAWVAAALVPALVSVGAGLGLLASVHMGQDRRGYAIERAERACAEALCPPDRDAISDWVSVSACRSEVDGFELCTAQARRCLRRDAGLQSQERKKSVERCVEAWLKE